MDHTEDLETVSVRVLPDGSFFNLDFKGEGHQMTVQLREVDAMKLAATILNTWLLLRRGGNGKAAE